MDWRKQGNGTVGSFFVDVLFDLVGTFIFALSVQCFSAPNSIAPGGVSGISILINHTTGLPISLVTLALNIPLLILAYLLLGKGYALRTVKSVLIMTVMLQLCGVVLPAYRGEPILAALYGGVLEGTGLAIVFLRGSSTGGTVIASRLIQLKFPYVPVGKLLLIVDGCVLIAAAIVYRSIESSLIALITIFCSTRMIDTILYGMDKGMVMMIFTAQHQIVAEQIRQHLARGCTLLYGKGTYSGEDRPVLFCAVRKNQLYDLKRLVREADSEAFLVVLEATDIIGQGFKNIDHKT